MKESNYFSKDNFLQSLYTYQPFDYVGALSLLTNPISAHSTSDSVHNHL